MQGGSDKDYWAMFAAACASDPDLSPYGCGQFADKMLQEMKSRFPDDAQDD